MHLILHMIKITHTFLYIHTVKVMYQFCKTFTLPIIGLSSLPIFEMAWNMAHFLGHVSFFLFYICFYLLALLGGTKEVKYKKVELDWLWRAKGHLRSESDPKNGSNQFNCTKWGAVPLKKSGQSDAMQQQHSRDNNSTSICLPVLASKR